MKELEASLGSVLFERFGRGVHLTSTGRALVPEAERLLLQAEEVHRLVREIEGGESGEVRVGATVSAANYILPEILAAFRRENPRVRLLLQPATSRKLLAFIRHNSLDLAVVDSAPQDVGLRTWGTIRDDIVVVVHPGHPLIGRRKVPLKTIAQQDWILREMASDTRGHIEDWARRKGIVLNVLMDMW